MTIRLTVLHTNDLHANYDEWLRQVAVLQELRAAREAAGETVLVVDAGDHLDMSVNECFATNGRMHLKMLEQAGYHALSMGNNELLRSRPEQIRELSLQAPIPFLLCNLKEADGSPIGGMQESVVLELASGLKVGLFGTTDQFETIYEDKHGFRNVDTVEAARKAIAQLKSQGAQVIVYVSHMSLEVDRELAKELCEDVHLIVGGHCHTALQVPEVVEGVVIAQAGALGAWVGEVSLEIEESTGRVVRHEGRLHPVLKDGPLDEVQAELLAEGRRETEAFLGEELLVLDKPWSHEEFVQVIAAAQKKRWGAEVGLMFGAVATEGLPAGSITQGTVYERCRSLVTSGLLEMQGQQFLGLLRESQTEVAQREGWGQGYRPGGIKMGRMSFAGLTYEERDGEFVNVCVNGEPLDLDRWYTVGSGNHLAYPESVGYQSLEGTRLLEFVHFVYVKDELIPYLRTLDPVHM